THAYLGGNRMPTSRRCWPVLAAVAGVLLPAGPAPAGDLYDKGPKVTEPVVLPSPTDVQSLDVYPPEVRLKGWHDSAQLVVTAKLADGRLQDLTHDVEYAAADGKTVHVTGTGRVL